MPKLKHKTLENFDPHKRSGIIISSPRSLEACRRQGIDPEELLYKSKEEFRKQLAGENGLTKELLELRWQHYEDRRQEKLRILLEERQQLIEEEAEGLWDFSEKKKKKSPIQSEMLASKHTVSKIGVTDSEMLERERRQLEKVKKKQEKEIEQMLQYELKMQEIREKGDQKIRRQKELEDMRQRELFLQRKEQEEIKRLQEMEKREKDERDAELQRRHQAEMYKQEQEKAEMEKMREKQRLKELKMKEEERKRSQEEFQRKTEMILLEQQMRVEKRKEEMEQRDLERKAFMEQQQRERIRKAMELREYHEQRIQAARENQEEHLRQQREQFEEKERQAEEKRERFRLATEERKEEARKRAEIKAAEIARIQEYNEAMEMKRREDFDRNQAIAEERKRQLDLQLEHERREKAQLEMEKDMHREEVRLQMERLEYERKKKICDELDRTDQLVKETQMRKRNELRLKKELETMKQSDRVETVQRIQKMKEYERNKLREKIGQEDERSMRIKQEREELLSTRAALRKQAGFQKDQLLDTFSKIKNTGRIDTKSLSRLGIDTDRLKSMSIQRSLDHKDFEGRPLRSAKTAKGKGQRSAKGSRDFTNEGEADWKEIALKRRSQMGNEQAGGNQAKKKKKQKPKQPQNEETKMSREVAAKHIEAMRQKHNKELLEILEIEQKLEAERDLQYQSINDPNERKRLEKIFGIERARASDRIVKISEEHENCCMRK